jgi:cytochrome c-type biogenesis protein CcmH
VSVVRPRWRAQGSGVVLATILVLVAVGATAQPAGRPAAAKPVNEQEVHDVAAQLRCVVCQTLSVADSPSEMAGQMRGIVRERLAAGDSPAQVRQYFVDRYGDWILLAPPRRGFTLLVWLAPLIAVLVGLGIVAIRISGGTRARRPMPPPVDAAMRERIQRELERET